MRFAVVLLLMLTGCSEPEPVYQWPLAEGFPQPVVPATNPMSAAKVELGRHLF